MANVFINPIRRRWRPLLCPNASAASTEVQVDLVPCILAANTIVSGGTSYIGAFKYIHFMDVSCLRTTYG